MPPMLIASVEKKSQCLLIWMFNFPMFHSYFTVAVLDTVSYVFYVYHIRTHQYWGIKLLTIHFKIIPCPVGSYRVVKNTHICKGSFALMGGIQLFKRIHVLNAEAALPCWEEYSRQEYTCRGWEICISKEYTCRLCRGCVALRKKKAVKNTLAECRLCTLQVYS